MAAGGCLLFSLGELSRHSAECPMNEAAAVDLRCLRRRRGSGGPGKTQVACALPPPARGPQFLHPEDLGWEIQPQLRCRKSRLGLSEKHPRGKLMSKIPCV